MLSSIRSVPRQGHVEWADDDKRVKHQATVAAAEVAAATRKRVSRQEQSKAFFLFKAKRRVSERAVEQSAHAEETAAVTRQRAEARFAYAEYSRETAREAARKAAEAKGRAERRARHRGTAHARRTRHATSRGVVIVLRRMRERFLKRGLDFVVKTIVCKNLTKERDFELDEGTTKTDDIRAIVDDDEITMVIEVMGGTDDAREVTLAALRAGKHVVSANKALLAQHLAEIEEALVENPGCRMGFEAAVAGGIPVIRSLQASFRADSVTRVAGILNGTTNFMLSAMHRDGTSYAAILREAQARGFAEADPSADVDGLDALAKLCILARLCFGVTIAPDAVPTQGIRAVTSEDFEYANMLNATIKLVGVAERRTGADGTEAVSAFLSPALALKDSTVGAVGGVDNIVVVDSENLGEVAFRGPGAGRFATANSVVSDMLAIAAEARAGPTPGAPSGPDAVFPIAASPGTVLDFDTVARFYIRLVIKDTQGVLRVVGELAERHCFSLYSVLQTPIKTRDRVAFVVTTDETRSAQVQAFAKDIRSLEWCLDDPLCMPFL
ncbi:hypothetical protein FNF29_01016 [Cafeteria roenbergensis]|uniref:Homoserine dehydrogenase n=1 Tax=Cafeteria roenbergensis TaxID=33653 RepID=A0A5A8CT26_CAFRO|nr:hypothetical protein FNF29_01016 [Cafeteria roenbergensis]|eukprot:KAA0156226.1 hypothetical protein FNF29_01016 [Cafeteria roenbergensis]